MRMKLDVLFDNDSEGRVFRAPDGNYISLRYGWEGGDTLLYTDDETVAKEYAGIYDDEE